MKILVRDEEKFDNERLEISSSEKSNGLSMIEEISYMQSSKKIDD